MTIALLCFAALCLNGLAASPSDANGVLGLNQLKQSSSDISSPTVNTSTKAAASAPVTQENITILARDSETNLSVMNITFTVSPTYGSAQTVKFTAPKPDWKLEHVLVIATDGWNASSTEMPKPLPFAIEIRDANLRLLYHFADTQLPYFTTATGFRIANVDVPSMPMNGDFFVCFYGYRSIALATELQNATGDSYLYDKLTGQLFSGALPLSNNQTIPVNWLLRVAGQ